MISSTKEQPTSMPATGKGPHDHGFESRTRNPARDPLMIPRTPTRDTLSPDPITDSESSSIKSTSTFSSSPPSPSPLSPSSSPSSPPRDPSRPLNPLRATLLALALSLLILVQSINISMLTTVQGRISSSLQAFSSAPWLTSAYLIPMSALGPLNGKLASVLPPRMCICASALLLALGSAVSGLAGALPAFLVGRAVAGAGASGIFTVGIAVALELSGPKRRGLGIGVMNSLYTVGVAVGAVAAGAVVEATGGGWRVLFWAQAPVCVLAGAGAFLTIPPGLGSSSSSPPAGDGDAGPAPSLRSRLSTLDLPGAALLTVSLGLLLHSLSSPDDSPPPAPILASLVGLALFALVELRFAPDPLVPLSLLRSRGLLCTCLATLGYMAARWTVLFYSPTYALALRGWSPASAGTLLVPTNLGFVLGSLGVGAGHIRRPGSFYLPTLLVYAAFPVTLVGLAWWVGREAERSAAGYVVMVGICGMVTGAALNYNLAHLLHLTPKHTHYVATALVATFRGFAGSIGSAVGGGLFTRTLDGALRRGFAERGMERGDLVRRLLGSPELVRELSGVEQDVAMVGYELALKTLFFAGAILALVMVFVQAGTGWKGPDEKEVDAERRPLLGDEHH